MTTTEERLWLDREYYIPIDRDGYCTGVCAEGALGFVIKTQSRADAGAQALKIPRLMGDTHRENAYISQLLEGEMQTVKEVIVLQQPGLPPTNGLLLPQRRDSILRGPISCLDNDSTISRWHEALIFVQFNKGRNPRFCLIKRVGEGLDYFPPELEQRPELTVDEFEKIKAEALQKTMFIELPAADSDEQTSKIFSIGEALADDPIGDTWYTGLPSITYGWAPGTLQESISRPGLRGNWKVAEDLELADRICAAICSLHARGIVHADVRPANIVIQGPESDPRSYYLADYGSFAQNTPVSTGTMSIRPLPSLGPVLAGERTSAFYALERRLGREREAADVAVILKDGTEDDTIVLLLGWRGDLIDDKGQPRMATIEESLSKRVSPVTADEYADTILRAGDRVQVRDFIFQLKEDEKRYADKQIFVCSSQVWQIYHGRIAITATKRFGLCEWIPVPRTIELLKWSVATDLYSLGALLLYSIFRRSPADQSNAEQPVDTSKAEDQFREMLTYLNSVPYFNAIWPELDWLRHEMERHLENRELNADSFAGQGFYAYDRDPAQQAVPNIDDPKTLLEAAVKLTQRLTQTAPGIYRLVKALDFNLATFIFLIHFALCCMHRKVHLSDRVIKNHKHPEWRQILPYCTDRHEETRSPAGLNGAAERVVTPADLSQSAAYVALERLDYLKQILGNTKFNKLDGMRREDNSDIKDYDPKPDFSVREQVSTLTIELAQERAENYRLNLSEQERQEAYEREKSRFERTERELTELKEQLSAREEQLRTRGEQLEAEQKLLAEARVILGQATWLNRGGSIQALKEKLGITLAGPEQTDA